MQFTILRYRFVERMEQQFSLATTSSFMLHTIDMNLAFVINKDVAHDTARTPLPHCELVMLIITPYLRLISTQLALAVPVYPG